MLFSLQASITIWVPSMFVKRALLTLSMMYCTPTPAAKWKQKSNFSNIVFKLSMSSTRFFIISILLLFEKSSKFFNLPVDKSSIINIFSVPFSNNFFTKLEPMKPAPPVMITLFRLFFVFILKLNFL